LWVLSLLFAGGARANAPSAAVAVPAE
jgi:hypothetical protein